jgi:Mn2+/Fe2+ NRAMP family transporter
VTARHERSVVQGAIFLMATSAVGPGFLTQTAVFTARLGADFAFAILASVLVDVAVQANVWRVLGVAKRRGPELASALLSGLGAALTLLVGFGGFVFNVGNVAGCGLGLAVLGVPPLLGAALSALASLVLLALPAAGRATDVFVRLLGGLMLALTAAVVVTSGPGYLRAAVAAVLPGRVEALPVLTLVGGTVGGYITFAGVHRLLDAGLGGPGAVAPLTRAAVLGILVTGAMRVLLFLAVLGVVGHGSVLDPKNPMASAFRHGAGEWGYRFFGVVLWAAAITSVVGCAYTTLSFARSLHPAVAKHAPAFLAAFILGSLAVYAFAGRPVRLLVLAGALNGLILPATLGVVLVAARRPELMGEYRHPVPLLVAGWLAFVIALVGGALSIADMRELL